MKKFLAIFVLLFSLGSVAAQVPPVNLGVLNLPQEGPVWCWAAVARQIIAWKHQNLSMAPQQCESPRVC